VIAQNMNRREKSLWTEQEPGEKIRLYMAANAWEECRFVTESIRSMRRAGIAAHDIAVLYRINFLSRSLETELISAGIPYRMYGGQRFYERKEIKDILAYLHVLLNPLDDISLQRIINVPKRSIGEASIAALSDYAREKEISLLAACQDAEQVLSKRAATAVGRFTDLMGTLAVSIAQQDPVDALETVIAGAGIREQYQDSKTDREENESRLRNIDELKNALQEYMSGNPEGTLQEFLEQASLMSSFDNVGDTEGAVTLMTLHGAKGLEFDNVFIIGLEDGTFPGERSIEDPERLEEERRLMYVGITRARRRLILSWAVTRKVYGSDRMFRPSMFLSAIPRNLLDDGRRPSPRTHAPLPAGASSTQRPRTVLGGRPAGSLGAGRSERLGNVTIPGVQRGFGSQVVVPSQAAPAPVSWKKGDRLRHKIFGTGTVLEVEGTGNGARLSVSFDRGGVRLLMADKAPLLPLTE
jgi:DNA helicase-2/ATP-dependent DNA helicase PcrA